MDDEFFKHIGPHGLSPFFSLGDHLVNHPIDYEVKVGPIEGWYAFLYEYDNIFKFEPVVYCNDNKYYTHHYDKFYINSGKGNYWFNKKGETYEIAGYDAGKTVPGGVVPEDHWRSTGFPNQLGKMLKFLKKKVKNA